MRVPHRAFALACAFVASASLLLAGRATAEPDFIVNGRFDSDIDGWTTASGVTTTWLASADRAGSSASGGMELRIPADGTTASGAYQCINVTPGTYYHMSANARVPLAMQSPGTYAYIFRVYYANSGCSSSTGQFLIGGLTDTSKDGWQNLSNGQLAPAGVQSMWIYLVLYKGTQGVEAYGYFDNVRTIPAENADNDACSDAQELGPDPVFGGERDHTAADDFYDVTFDRAIDLADATAILARFGSTPQSGPPYDALFDRYSPDPAEPWRTAQPPLLSVHEGIDLSDALVNLQSFGHSCDA